MQIDTRTPLVHVVNHKLWVQWKTRGNQSLQVLCERSTLHSQELLAHKDDDFILGKHVSDEVKHVGLFLLFLDDQYRLLHCVNCLRNRDTEVPDVNTQDHRQSFEVFSFRTEEQCIQIQKKYKTPKTKYPVKS